MALDKVDLGDLAFSSYIYCRSTKYDCRYQEFISRVGGDICLSDPSHGAALLKWLNGWGCRQFAVDQHTAASRRLLQWSAEYADHLPPPGERLDALDDKTLARVAYAYEALRPLTASVRKDGVRMTVGPTGAAKIMFALRPRQLPPWDDPIRAVLGYKGDMDSYFQYLLSVQNTIRRLHLQLESVGLDEQAFSALIDRPDVTLPKLIDEYMWMTVTRGFEPPTKTALQHWLSWKSK